VTVFQLRTTTSPELEEVGHYIITLCIMSSIAFLSLHFQLSSLVACGLFRDQAGNSLYAS